MIWKPATLLYPVPVVLVSCGELAGTKNILTIAWAGTIASDPVMLSISVRPERFSYALIQKHGEFVVNLPNKKMVRAVDFCGVKSGREMDKFAATRLTAVAASTVKAPLIAESPLSLECKVTQIIPLGSHHLFLAKVLAVQVERDLVAANGRLDLGRANLLTYLHGHYWTLREPIGNFGFSVKKHPKR